MSTDPIDFPPEAIERDLRRAIALGRVSIVEREVTSSGAPGVFEMVQAPQFAADGTVQRIFVSARDISERKRVERLKNEFVSTVSHELRTPLTSIAGSLGLLAGGAAGTLGDKARHLVAIAHSNSLRLVRLINDILDIEKIEAGRMTFEVRTVLVRELIEQAVGGLSGYAEDLGVRVEVAEGARGLMVRGDPDRLTQVVTNLVGNAIKFSPRGETVTVASAAEGDIVMIAVRDRGPGIPEAFQPRLFSKFAQADGSDTRRLGGTGLGLAIAREIVERHAGAISFRMAFCAWRPTSTRQFTTSAASSCRSAGRS
ncbi:ATP-binding protein [Hansschlegelia beijingensis]